MANEKRDNLEEQNPIGQDNDPVLENVTTNTNAEPIKGLSFPIVGVGASAGGVEAFTQLLKALPKETGMAFVIIPHLDPTHDSAMAEILGRSTAMPVMQVTDEPLMQPNHVYVIPPDRNMIAADGHLKLVPRKEGRGPQRSIDLFLRSLAEDQQHRAIGVILSGSGSDGMLGLEEIKAEGGITFAQDDTAQHESMPRSAIASGCVDYVLPPDEIAKELVRLSRHPYVAPQRDVQEEAETRQPSLVEVLDLLHRATGVDFTHYKRNTLYRRITRRAVLHKMDSLKDYVRFLQNTPSEVEALYQDILINVTSFFRNPEAFDVLKQKVFPRLMENRSRHDSVRIWVQGCATGEEAYSLAMAFSEYAETVGKTLQAQIFATDLNGTGIEKARAGIYAKNIVQDVSPERLRRFFAEVDGCYRINKTIRELCVFARHNMLTAPPFSHIDLVSCRNVLIYLDATLQQKLVPIMHYALNPHGFLWLGTSETIGNFRDLFELEDAKFKIYSKKPGTGRPAVNPVLTAYTPEVRGHGSKIPRLPIAANGGGLDTQKEADRFLLARYAPAGVVVNGDLDILQFRGNTGLYLEPAPGRASLNLLKMLREGLLVSVRGAFHKAKKEEVPVREENLHVKSNGGYHDVHVEVIPLKGNSTHEGCFLVLFEEAGQPLNRARLEEPVPVETGDGESAEREINRLKQELAATREYLQSVIEQQEGANEELQSANEEVQSANEELQSINEELETSKEEIQSSNEELATVNDELHNRNLELSQSNNDLLNLLTSVQMAILMVGADLRIRRFTPTAEKLFNLIPADVGRPVGDIKLNVPVDDLEKQLAEVIDTVSVREMEVQDKQGRWFSLRLRPYKTLENKIDGAVIVLVDVDTLKRAQLATKESEERYRLLVECATGFAIMMLDPEGKVMSWNLSAQRVFGFKAAEIVGEHYRRFFLPEDIQAGKTDQILRQAMLQEEGTKDDHLLVRRDGSRFWASGTTTALRDQTGQLRGYSKVVQDISERKRLEEALRQRIEELAAADRAKNEFLALLAHELRNPLAPMRNAVLVQKEPGAKPEVLKQAQEIIERQIQNMTRLIDDLLDVSRITQGKITLRKVPLDLATTLTRVVESVGHHVKARGQHLAVNLPEEPITVEADPIRLEQVFGNLLHNASKFTPPGGHLWLSAKSLDHGRRPTVEVRLRDDGSGISREALPRIFDMFMQAEHSLDRTQGGLGIGLTLVKNLVELHGGQIEAVSAGPGKGSEFIVRLPTSKAAPHLTHDTTHEPLPRQDALCRILVVDDNVDAADTLAMLLKFVGHDVKVVHDGAAALKVTEQFHPQVVLLDIGMPRMDGYEVARRMRQQPGMDKAILMALTGYGQDEDRRRAWEAGFDHHLTKPVSPVVLCELLAHSTGRKR
jgi:two-component system, chemotaxis family, CheB/CheR fusion protein